MKALRIFMMVAFLVLPLFASQAMAQAPPVINCPDDTTQDENGWFQTLTGSWDANDGNTGVPAYWLDSVTVDLSSLPPGITNAQIVYEGDTPNPPSDSIKTTYGYVRYYVADHCQSGGSITLKVWANWTAPPQDTNQCSFTVTLTNPDPPTITCPANVSGDYDVTMVSADFVTADPNGDQVGVSITNVTPMPSNMPTIPAGDPDHVVWVPTCADVGIVYTIELTPEDECGLAGTACTFTMTATNTAPAITCPGDLTFDYFTGYSDAATATDPEEGALTTGFSLISGPTGLNVAASGAITWTTDCNDVGGPYPCSVRVTDECGVLYDTCVFQLTVTNAGPTITCPGNLTFDYVTGYSDAATATDPEEGALTTGFSLISGPTGLNVAASGAITWNTDCNDVGGPYPCSVRVTDECGVLYDTCVFQLTVTNAPPTITCPANYTGLYNVKMVSTDFVTTDPEGQLVIVTITDVTPTPSNAPTIVADHVEWQPTCVDTGITYTVELTPTDPCNLSGTVCTFTMTAILPNTHLDTTWVPWATVGRNSDDAPVLGFRIDCIGSGDFLESITVKSFIQKAFSIEKLSLYAETGGGKGLQVASDTKVGEIDVKSLPDPSFDSNDTLKFLLLPYALNPDSNLFYIALDAFTDSLSAAPSFYQGECLEVIIEPGRMVLSSGWTNLDTIYNRPDWAAGDPCITGFYPWLPGCRYRLCFDTEGPQFDLHFAVPFLTCSTSMVDLGDSVRIWADNIDSDIKGDITIVDPNKLFLWSALKLKDPTYDTTILIPDIRNTTALPGIDADTGQWILCAWAIDSADNQDTTCLEHDDLPLKIDTRKPLIDSVQILLTSSGDANGDGQIGLNDCITIHGWGLSNPDWEIAKMWVDMSHFGKGSNVAMPDAENNNKHFWVTVCLDVPWAVDSMDSNYNQVLVWAEDNACNQDTSRKGTPLMVDLEPPEITDALYYYHRDLDTAYSCIGIGDSAKISANVTGISDLVSVTCDLVEAGIDGPADQPLDSVGGGWYELLWEVGEPPIADGKDTNNTNPPLPDYDYTVLITVTDDVGNTDALRTNRLNRTLDTRRPRWIYPDSIQCTPIAGAMLTVWWDTSADENDAAYFYVYCDSGAGSFDWLVGGTWKGEQGSLPGGDDRIELWSSEPGQLRDGQYYRFKVQIEDDCGNLGDFGPVVGGFTDGTAPHVCIAMPDSGLTFGAWFPIKAVADSASHDVDGACLWYRLMDIDGLGTVGPWTECTQTCMYRFGSGYVFTDSVYCIGGLGYTGWVELIVVACDETGNYQDTTMAYDDACLVEGDLFRAGHFLFYWDESLPVVTLTSVNGYPSPQTSCGFDVERGVMNEVVFTVDGATAADSFEVEVRGPGSDTSYIIFHEDNVTMPCTIWVSVDGWSEGSQNLYIYAKDYDNNKTGNLQIQLCVPPPPLEHCIYISEPVEWQRIRCTGTSGQGCVTITAEKYNYAFCAEVTFNEVVFQWSPNGIDSWEMIEEVIGDSIWSTCWDNTDLVEDGDTIYFRAIAHDEYYVADTSFMVKVFVDCQAPNVQLLMEPLYYTCGNETPKISCDTLLTLKAVVLDDTVDISEVNFYVKKHSDPDIYAYWSWIGQGDPAYYANIWVFMYEDVDTLAANQLYDFRIGAIDQANQVMFDYDGDGLFDDSTFNAAVGFDAGMTVFLDCEAPQPAISKVCDQGQEPPICIVNPSSLLGGADKAYVQAGHDITSEISVLPSEDTCEVMKVHWFLSVCDTCWRHVGTSTDPNHYPVTFNPLTDGTLDPYELEDGWWQGNLKAVLYDSLGNSTEDIISLYILDVTPSQAVIINPWNDSYVYGDVQLSILALNKYQIAKVCYEFRHEDSTNWYPINGGYPNACITGTCDSLYNDFDHVWHTMNTVDDGVYYLRAVATDCDNNVDNDPPTIRVTVANGLPSVVLDDPRICERECPDDTVDTLGYVAGTVTLYATATSDIPVDRVEFQYKSIFGYPDTYTDIDTAYFVSGGKYSVEWSTGSLNDGRYHVIARVYNAAGRYGDSDPVTITVDNSAPFAQIVSIMGDPNPDGMDISLGDVIDIELWAMDSTSDEGWTRCYNSGVVSIEVCIEDCVGGTEYTKCFEVSPAYDGFHTIQWNTSGLEFEGCSECYKFNVKATDCLGNVDTSEYVTVYVYDITAPITTIAGFDGNYIYGYSSEKVSTLQFQYADSGSTNWIPIGWSSYVGAYCNYLYKTSWDYSGLADGIYQIRVISHDSCSNQDDSLAPVVYFSMYYGSLTPYYDPEVLFPMSFLKNWCTGDMQGIVQQTVTSRTPVMIARYDYAGSSYGYECVHMQSEIGSSDEFAGSFDASAIANGGSAKFFSSVTLPTAEIIEVYTGEEPAYVTYLLEGSFDIAKVKTDVGTHGTYQEGCVEITVQGGAVDSDRYIWVAPTEMQWAPIDPDQSDILPIGDNNGYATHISFTDCEYCCGTPVSAPFDGEGVQAAGAGTNSTDCCFNPGKHAILKMCYDSTVVTPKEDLAVAWWDCVAGEYKFSDIFYPATVGGFNTENNTVEFATPCLKGPFVVVQLLEPGCENTTLQVAFREISPYCGGYTSPTPTITTVIKDNIQGTSGINQSSIKFWIDDDQLYDGSQYDCDKWTKGFGNFEYSGYHPEGNSGKFLAGWSVNSSNYPCYDQDHKFPAPSLAAGEHTATVTAMNYNIQSCTRTYDFTVDATEPTMWFADAEGAYVGENPHFCIYFNDTESGVDKNSIWIDLYGDETNSPDPNNHQPIGTITPAMLTWINDTTVCVDETFEYYGGYLHVFVYGGPECRCGGECAYPDYYDYLCGIADCVGNHTDVFWQYYTVDADGPNITPAYTSLCDASLKFQITDDMSGLLSVYVYEDSTLTEAIQRDVHNPDFWWYTPTEGTQRVDIEAKDNLGNVNVFSFDLPSDCEGPAVEFADGYVAKNPTLTFWVTDPAGVDWTTVNAYITGCSEACYYYAPDLTDYIDTETGKVTLSGCHLDCSDGQEVELYVFSGTSYTGDGPCDLEGNCGKYRQCSFVVDADGPSITWTNSSDPCDRPVKLQITDAKSGVDEVLLYEDGVDVTSALVYNTASGLWEYTPATGMHVLDVVATDVVGNQNTYSFEVKDDCQGPAVSFASGYVTKNPTIKFTVTDPSGVDWTTVNAKVEGCSEECWYLAPVIKDYVNTETGEVTLEGCNLDCSDGQDVMVYVYSGTSPTGAGPADLFGNYVPDAYKCSYNVDAFGPTISVGNTSERPIKITLVDPTKSDKTREGSGVDWSSLKFYEDGDTLCQGLDCTNRVSIDTLAGVIEYDPPAGRKSVEIRIWDRVGNYVQAGSTPDSLNTFYTEEENLFFTEPHNYPNPFDSREGRTTIILGLSRSAHVTVKIYDFAGEFVTTIAPNQYVSTSENLYWDGTTEGGTAVANGTYLCYIKAKDSDGATKTAVIKITVIKRDK
ncbi:MAG: hypothetical protein KAW02_01280 [candidate division Zixibacteria bacterium]|nr:hypothetical protein [candidate division Zixibacteria bacterium]